RSRRQRSFKTEREARVFEAALTYFQERPRRSQPRFGTWPVAKIDHESIQLWVNDMSAAGLSPRTVRWTHSILKMSLDYAADAGQLSAKNPAEPSKFPPTRHAPHTYLTTAEVAALTVVCGSPGRHRRTAGLHRRRNPHRRTHGPEC